MIVPPPLLNPASIPPDYTPGSFPAAQPHSSPSPRPATAPRYSAVKTASGIIRACGIRKTRHAKRLRNPRPPAVSLWTRTGTGAVTITMSTGIR